MGTVPPEEETPPGYIQRAGHTATVLSEATSEVAYGRSSGSVYPLLLILAVAALVGIGYPWFAMVPLLLLAIWVGGHR